MMSVKRIARLHGCPGFDLAEVAVEARSTFLQRVDQKGEKCLRRRC
jgi:hypothetical protein